jgi:PAS domain S-box-containing protein
LGLIFFNQKERMNTSTNVPAESELCRALIQHMADAVIFADRAGLIQLWNAGAEAVFGYAGHEVIGKSLDLIIPERLRRAHWEGYQRALAAGHTRHGRRALPTRSLRKDGSTLYVELSFSVVLDAAGAVTGAVAVGRDITARFLAEKEQRRRVDELEAQLKALSRQ